MAKETEVFQNYEIKPKNFVSHREELIQCIAQPRHNTTQQYFFEILNNKYLKSMKNMKNYHYFLTSSK
jgi:hypothetical protein